MMYRYEVEDNGAKKLHKIVEVREDGSEIEVYVSLVEKKVKEIYRQMKRGQVGFNGWTPQFLTYRAKNA
jgi:ribosome-binding factor A